MKFFEKIAILFFDIIDKYFHQKEILKYLKENLKEIEIFFDIGSHKGLYTDLIINNFQNIFFFKVCLVPIRRFFN